MGSFLSSLDKAPTKDHAEVSYPEGSKRLKIFSAIDYEHPRLLPGLPDEISWEILARIPRIHYLNLKLVSRSWRTAISSREIYLLRKELKITEEWLYILLRAENDKLIWYALDPVSGNWQRLPPMPDAVFDEATKRSYSKSLLYSMVESGIKITDLIRGWLGRKVASDKTPFYGCSTGSVDGCLYVLGGFSKASAMKCVWRYDPYLNSWLEVNSMITGRAFCKTGLLDNKLYVVGGVDIGRGGINPLRSAEVYDPSTCLWTQLGDIPFSQAEASPTAFLADSLKPVATGMTSYLGKLYVPESLYSWPFYVDMGGEVYDPKTNSWMTMPAGMGDGWPARQAGMKLGVVVGEELYALDPSTTLNSGKIKMYDRQEDSWKIAIENVPLYHFTESEAPYLLASFYGGLHLITKGANKEIMVLQADLWPTSLQNPNEEDKVSGSWKTISSRNFGAAELVGCQVLDA